MPGCIFHASGEQFAVEAFLAESSLDSYKTYHRGELLRRPISGDRFREESGFCVEASAADGDLEAECADVLQFLRIHAEELARLSRYPGVTDIRLDFAYYRRRASIQCDYLPPELLMLAGAMRIGIELSLYPQEKRSKRKSHDKNHES